MHIDLEKIRAFFAADRFAASAGVVIDMVTEDAVECGMALAPKHLNAGGVAQGGAIFTLADLAFAVHANLPFLCGASVGMTVGQSNSISFLAAPRGKRLIARSTCLSRGRSVSVFRVEVRDDTDRLIAEMLGNGFTKAI
ncbi:MAG: PaaI family thioesterase [Zoogloeaceae bacterium]|jgi:acyl-CoA thioesterase|nr:PaaI family thioesterase [Zoogloeaceae bacterium]